MKTKEKLMNVYWLVSFIGMILIVIYFVININSQNEIIELDYILATLTILSILNFLFIELRTSIYELEKNIKNEKNDE